MNPTYQINAQYAVSKAIEAVRSWEAALEVQTKANDPEGIDFCQRSLAACKATLAKVRESVKDVQQWL